MKSTSNNASANKLGTKRNCPKCATKFYDLNKEDIVCPKCKAELDREALLAASLPKLAPEPKKAAKAVVKEADEESGTDGPATAESEFESVEELADDEEALVEELDVDGDESEN